MANGIKRNDDGTFTVSKAWLTDALETAFEKGMGNNNCCSTCVAEEIMNSSMKEKYDAPVVIVDSVYRPTMELLIEINSDHKKSSSRKTKNPFRTSQMY